MSAAIGGRPRLTLGLAACAYAAVFIAFVTLERPGLGIGHFFYIPVCLVALASDWIFGAAAGLAAAGLYIAAVQASPHLVTGQFTPATLIRAVTFAAVGGLVGLVAGRNRALVARLRTAATTDYVTGAANVRAFDEELAGLCRAGSGFSLVLFDIDDLRRVNEIHGHPAGDAGLRRVAQAISAWAKDGDVVARIGGDEFALLTSLPVESVPALTARVNSAIAPDELSVTTAATAAPGDGVTADDLLRKAEGRLFAAKLVGANRRLHAVSTR